jgi:hypothetical protein
MNALALIFFIGRPETLLRGVFEAIRGRVKKTILKDQRQTGKWISLS